MLRIWRLRSAPYGRRPLAHELLLALALSVPGDHLARHSGLLLIRDSLGETVVRDVVKIVLQRSALQPADRELAGAKLGEVGERY